MKNLSNIFITKFPLWGLGGFFFVTNVIFAQGPDPDAMPGDSNLTDASIDANLLFLTIAGIVFCYSFYTRKLKID